ncbi:MAG: NADH-quinone oxidoreductase subunit C [Thermogutta sp.]|nr:MAG: NADH-quinone oxidoreductase subunit C [Thermogutta sp.]
MDIEAIFGRLQQQFGEAVRLGNVQAIDPWIEVAREKLPEVCHFLRDDPDLRFEMLHCITAVDYLETDPKKAAKAPFQPHLELVYHLSSLSKRHRLVLKVMLPRWEDDVEGRLPRVPTVSNIWSAAEWHEREVYDLSGVEFVGHPDLRRMLCPEDWVGHPLRKDYQMPKEYHGIRVR